MPYRPKKPCADPTCKELVEPRYHYCRKHRSAYTTTRDRARKNTPAYREYASRRYRALRLVVLEEEPTCRLRLACQGAPSTEADHIIPVSQGGQATRGNLQGSCKRCNRAKAALGRKK